MEEKQYGTTVPVNKCPGFSWDWWIVQTWGFQWKMGKVQANEDKFSHLFIES